MKKFKMQIRLSYLSLFAIVGLTACGGGGGGATSSACKPPTILSVGYKDPRLAEFFAIQSTSFNTFASLEKVEYQPVLPDLCGVKPSFGFATGSPAQTAGLTINQDTGVISGIPTTTGAKNFNVGISAPGYSGMSTRNIQFTVDDYAFTYTSSTTVVTVGTSVALLPVLNDGAFILPTPGSPLPIQGNSNSTRGSFLPAGATTTYSLLSGALPPGLTLNPSTGLISGAPTTIGIFDLKVALDATFSGATLRAADWPIQSMRITVN